MSTAQFRAEYRRDRGYIGQSGIVICGECFDGHRFDAAGNVSERCRFDTEAWERYNPSPGDDFCSECDRDITRAWRETELTDA